MTHRYEFDGVCMQRSLVGRAATDKQIVHRQVSRQLRGGFHCIVGNDFVAGAVVENADNRAVLHGPTSQVAHTFIGSLAEEIAALDVRKGCSDGGHGADCRHIAYLIIYKLGNIDGDVSTITFGPAFLPEITGNFGHLVYLAGQCGASVQNRFHTLFFII